MGAGGGGGRMNVLSASSASRNPELTVVRRGVLSHSGPVKRRNNFNPGVKV